MDDAEQARMRIISGVETSHGDLIWFDLQMFWHIIGSTSILYGTAGGAFILACETLCIYRPFHILLNRLRLYTHCWSRLLVWWLSLLYCQRHRHLCTRDDAMVVSSNILTCAAIDIASREDLAFQVVLQSNLRHRRRTLNRQNSDRWTVRVREKIREWRRMWSRRTFTDRLGPILRLLEIVNTVFLIYIIVAQSIGAYMVGETANDPLWDGKADKGLELRMQLQYLVSNRSMPSPYSSLYSKKKT